MWEEIISSQEYCVNLSSHVYLPSPILPSVRSLFHLTSQHIIKIDSSKLFVILRVLNQDLQTIKPSLRICLFKILLLSQKSRKISLLLSYAENCSLKLCEYSHMFKKK